MLLNSIKCVNCNVRKDEHTWNGGACQKFVWPQEQPETAPETPETASEQQVKTPTNAPRPNVISRFLKDQGFTRATRIQGTPASFSGFEVSTKDGKTVVTYTLGNGNPRLTQERRRELVSSVVYAMEKALSSRYTVNMFEPAEGVSYRLTLPGDSA